MPPVTPNSVSRQLLILTPDEADLAYLSAKMARELNRKTWKGINGATPHKRRRRRRKPKATPQG